MPGAAAGLTAECGRLVAALNLPSATQFVRSMAEQVTASAYTLPAPGKLEAAQTLYDARLKLENDLKNEPEPFSAKQLVLFLQRIGELRGEHAAPGISPCPNEQTLDSNGRAKSLLSRPQAGERLMR